MYGNKAPCLLKKWDIQSCLFLKHQTGPLLLSFQAEPVGGALALRVPVTKRTT